jgi:hypothetical protein
MMDHDSCDTTIEIMRGKDAHFARTLISKYGRLSISSNPDSAIVFVNGTESGKTPYAAKGIVPGACSLMIEMAGYDTCDTVVEIHKGEELKVSIPLVRRCAALVVSTNPSGASVLLDGAIVGRTPYETSDLEPGSYLLRVDLATYESVKQEIALAKGDSIGRTFTLRRTKAYVDAVVAAEKHARKRFRTVGRIVCGSLAAGAGGAGYYYNVRVKEADKVYDAYQGSDAETHRKNWQVVEDKRHLRNAAYSVAGVFGGIFLVLWIPF